LQAKVDTTVKQRAETRRRTLPQNPACAFINLQLLQRQHGKLLERLQPQVQQAAAVHRAVCIQERETNACQDRILQVQQLLSSNETAHAHFITGLQQDQTVMETLAHRFRMLDTEEDAPNQMAETYEAKIREIDDNIIAERERWQEEQTALQDEICGCVGVKERFLEEWQTKNWHAHTSNTHQPIPLAVNHRVRVMGFVHTDMAHLNGLVGTTRELDHETQHCTVQLEQLDTRLECRGDKLESSGVALECNALYSRWHSPWSCLRGRVDLSLRSGVD